MRDTAVVTTRNILDRDWDRLIAKGWHIYAACWLRDGRIMLRARKYG